MPAAAPAPAPPAAPVPDAVTTFTPVEEPARPAARAVLAAPAEAPKARPAGPARPGPRDFAREWERIVREVGARESVLAETRNRRIARPRQLQSLVATLRDRDILYEKGMKVGRTIHSAGYADLAQKLKLNGIAETAEFRSRGDEIEARLTGTDVSKGAPRIGTPVCFLEAGIIAGALDNLEGARFAAKETRCVAAGDPFCEFRVARGETSDG